MGKKAERRERELSIADAASEAISDLTGLGEEMREVYDNMPENLQGGDLGSRRDEAATAMEDISEPDYCELAQNTQIKFHDLPVRKRGYSRADRCGQACYILSICVDTLREFENADLDQDKKDELSQLADDLEEIKDNSEGVEWPGMYG